MELSVRRFCLCAIVVQQATGCTDGLDDLGNSVHPESRYYVVQSRWLREEVVPARGQCYGRSGGGRISSAHRNLCCDDTNWPPPRRWF